MMNKVKTSNTDKNADNTAPSPSGIDGEGWYLENGYVVFTEAYHLKRGYCCKNDCRHCPYGFRKRP